MVKKKKRQSQSPRIVSSDAPFEYVEAYKTLRTNFHFVTMNGENRKIVVTSTLQDEGKSSVAINLAISLAEAGKKVLLIDADMRNPSLHRYLQLKKDHATGLSNLLTGILKMEDCLMETSRGFDIIPGGPVPPNPVELISSPAMGNLLKVAEEQYDYIICDAPPVGVITDAAALSPMCDGVLFVIRQKMANKVQVRAALQGLKTVNAKILGTVLNQYDISKDDGKGYGYYRSYGYRTE